MVEAVPGVATTVDPRPVVDAFLAAGGRAVTLDVFDTLLWRRTLFPADVFGLLPHGWWGRVSRRWVEAGVTAFCRRGLRREPRLQDIYGAAYPFDVDAELALEAQLTRANPACLDLVRHLAERRVPLLAVSDMVMSGAQIEALLQAAGYPALAVLSSADAGVSKRVGGRLFQRALQRLGAEPVEVLHVGDDWHADIAMSRQQGLACVRVRAPRETVLALRPELARARLDAQASLFWGDVALALQPRLAPDAPDMASLRARLDRLLREQPATAWQAAALVDALLAPPSA